MIDCIKIQNLNQSIRESAEKGLSQSEALVRMNERFNISDSFRLRIWIAVGYCMYNKEKGGR